MVRKLAALAAMALLAGCACVGSADFARDAGPVLVAEPRPVLSGFEDEGESLIKFGARGGVVLYSASDVAPRVTVGAYGFMTPEALEESGRLEVAVEITPDMENFDRGNMYIMFAGDYVGYIGESPLSWKAGPVGVFEMQGDKMFFLLGVEGGIELWFAVGGEDEEVSTAVTVNAMLQLYFSAFGGDVNSPITIAITGGYEF